MPNSSQTPPELRLSDFDYPFPPHLVAQEPTQERDGARLLVRMPSGELRDAHVAGLMTELQAGTELILNASRVFPSRLQGFLPSGGQVELFLLAPLTPDDASITCHWQAMGRPLKKLNAGSRIHLAGDVIAEVLGKTENGTGNAFVQLRFNRSSPAFADWLEQHGLIPLPPYIKRDQPQAAPQSLDRDRYQTVYAQDAGSVAAPTAGLHFTQALLDAGKRRGIHVNFVSLHVGAGTFLPVKSEDPSAHVMHPERYRVGAATAAALCKARAEGRPVVAVGTTTLRSLEDLYLRSDRDPVAFVAQADRWHQTQLYIHPRTAQETYKPWVIDGLITNFHQPCSTLFMLISALIGLEQAKLMYQTAIMREYRLYSYGDASLLWL